MPVRSGFTKNALGIVLLFALVHAGALTFVFGQAASKNKATITIDRSRVIREFDPNETLGAGIDGHDLGEIEQLLSPTNIEQMLTAGLKPVSYRLRTELANEAWHWNPKGAWSDAEHSQGYWTSDPDSNDEISLSYGYNLPRRGNTIDQAENIGFSRIDDGDTDSYWKSNPYLDQIFTNEDNALHHQWVVVDMGDKKSVNAVRIKWGAVFATDYEIQYADRIDMSDIAQNPPGLWHSFTSGKVIGSRGGEVLTKVSRLPVKTRYIRILLKKSPLDAAVVSTDIRDKVGFAIRELYVGNVDAGGHFTDEIRHSKETKKQTNIFVSSTDSWHRPDGLDPNTEHMGFDRLFKSGLTNGLPVLMPVSILYDTPENAAAEVKYLIRKGYPIKGIELGEEPDGQYITPEDYGALYIQWTGAIHKIDPQLKIGGPSFQEIEPDTREGKFEGGNAVWLERFLKYMESRGHTSDFSFFSFEWYPFDDVCKPTGPQVVANTRKLSSYLNVFRKHGLKTNIPLVIAEYGYSAFSTQAEVDIEGALFNADTVGAFLTMGGAQAYLYGYEPNRVERDFACTSGNNMLFVHDVAGKIQYRTSTYFGANLVMTEWLQPSGGMHKMVFSDTNPQKAHMVVSYAVQRPDGLWSLMLINRDPKNIWDATIRAGDNRGRSSLFFKGEAELYQFSSEQYKWDAALAHPSKSSPPEHGRITRDNVQLPPYSITVLRGAVK